MEKQKILTFNEPTYIIITDPCYFVPNTEWEESRYGEELPFPHITENTGIGDWDCDVMNTDTGDWLAAFTADTGMCTVASFDDIINFYGPALYDVRRECYAVIKDFKGTVRAVHDKNGILHIFGEGNINFASYMNLPDGWEEDMEEEEEEDDAFTLQPTADGWWMLTDNETGACIHFKEGKFNEMQHSTVLDNSGTIDPIAVARVMRRMGDWLATHRPDLV